MKKALVLYSGGLDSRLAIKLLQKQGFQVEALNFTLPFGCSSCANLLETMDGIKLTTFNIKKEPLLSEYLELLKNPRHGTGVGINPCKDCKIFMLKKAKEYADKNDIQIIATGEVLGQRPMSQVSAAMKTINEKVGFEVLRPLSAKNLPETSYEKSGLVDRDLLLGISGRGRREQMELAKEFKIKYPSPSGGCFLCEKYPSRRLKRLLKENLITEKTLPLTTIGRHFFINDVWFVVSRNFPESQIVTTFQPHIPDEIGKPAVYYNSETGKEDALRLQEAYSTGDKDEERSKFKKYKL